MLEDARESLVQFANRADTCTYFKLNPSQFQRYSKFVSNVKNTTQVLMKSTF